MSDSEDLNIGDFNPETYEHVLPEGAHDYNDYDSEYEREHPELGYTDEQVEEEVKKLKVQKIANGMRSTRSSWKLITDNMGVL